MHDKGDNGGDRQRKSKKFGKTALILILSLVFMAIITSSVSASGTPTKLIVFTDKKVYLDGGFDGGAMSEGTGITKDFTLTVYAVVLDDDGNMLTDEASSLSGTMDDVEQWDHYHKGDASYHHNITYNPSFNSGAYEITLAPFTDPDGDGIYESFNDLAELDNAGLLDDHLLINITVTHDVAGTVIYQALFSQLTCHKSGDYKHTGGSSPVHLYDYDPATNAGSDPCGICHHGYEHMFDNLPEAAGLKAGHYGNITPNNTVTGGKIDGWTNNLSVNDGNTPASTMAEDNPGSEYCYTCHLASNNRILDYSVAAYGDDSTDRPSCSWAKSNFNATCHDTTNIEAASLTGVDWHWKANGSANTTSHAHPGNIANVSCEICHQNWHANTLPESNPGNYSDINEQCWSCHNASDGEINGIAMTTDCKSCHQNTSTNTLNTHAPEEDISNESCTSCHDIGGSAINVNVSSMNTTTAVHRLLNNRSGDPGFLDGVADWNNRRCWACHGNGTKPSDGHADLTNMTTPWGCWDCHNATNRLGTPNRDYNTAANVSEHVQEPYQEDIMTNGTGSTGNGTCQSCHTNDIGDSGGSQDGAILNASLLANVSHYAQNDSLMDDLALYPWANSTNCIYCHNDTANASKWGNATFLNLPTHNNAETNGDCYGCHVDGGVTPATFHAAELNAGAGGPDCVSCHDIGGSASPAEVNVSAMNMSSNAIHRNLTEGIVNTSAISDEVDKACWACHGNGTQPSAHPDNYKTPWECYDCHTNTTGGIDEATGKGNYSAPGIYAHIPANATVNYTDPTDINTTVQCWTCHNNSVAPANDTLSKTINQTAKSNVSHYGTNQSLYTDSWNCWYCHKNATNAKYWYIQPNEYVNYTIRHPAMNISNYTSCRYCHNSSSVDTFHSQNLTMAYFVHRDYDWEGDGNDPTGPDPPAPTESCYPCHNGTQPGQYPRKTCEDCHTINETLGYPNGPYTAKDMTSDGDTDDPNDYKLRSDYNQSVPIIYEHWFNATDVQTKNQSTLVSGSITGSTCLGWNNDTLTGVCHGVSYSNRTDKYFAFSNRTLANKPLKPEYPYIYNAPIDFLPNTTNCTYCHLGNDSIRWEWGDATNITNSAKRNHTENQSSECYACHVAGGVAPKDFHAQELSPPTCTACHFNWGSFNATQKSKFINETEYNASVHGNLSVIYCTGCHTNYSYDSTNHSGASWIPPESGWKWCEDCHVVNQSTSDPNRHNLTDDPLNNMYNSTNSVMNITDCTACHDATIYNNATATYNRTSGKDCRYCHNFPDYDPESPY